MLKRVGLIGPESRPEMERLAIRLEERGGEAVFLDPGRDAAIEVGPDRLSACGEDLSSLSALYVADLGLRSSAVRLPGGELDPVASRAGLESSRRQLAAWNVLFSRFAAAGGLVVNPPDSHAVHALKPYEIASYEEDGIPVPRTIATTDAEELAGLAAAPGSGWVTKGMDGGYSYTRRFDPPASREQALLLLAEGPVMAQELIEGDNVRAFVAGGEVIGAAEIMPVMGAEIDSRRGDARVRRIDLPQEAARHAIAAAGRWGMVFSAVDFMREDATGRFVLLECNSAPFFVAFEASTGLEISGRLANLLLRIRRSR